MTAETARGPTGLPPYGPYDAPNYLARYTERRGLEQSPPADAPAEADEAPPLYLRRFRDAARGRGLELPVETSTASASPATSPDVHAEKEIVAPPERKAPEEFATEIRIIRHGITQGYSTDAGLTPMGGWQAHQRGHSLSKALTAGQKVRIVCADTNRARQTAEQIYRGMLDGLDQWRRKAEVSEPEPIPELRNFGVWTPDGLRDVTSAFRQYQAMMEKLERMAVGDRPRWLVEIDRFYRTQLGGADPIHMWLTIPLMYFEPPASVRAPVLARVPPADRPSRPDTRIVAATHSGPIRAFATWAHGYDPGEPYNTEEVVVKVRRGGGTALVAYRNRVTEVNVPPPDEMPVWD